MPTVKKEVLEHLSNGLALVRTTIEGVAVPQEFLDGDVPEIVFKISLDDPEGDEGLPR